VRRRTAIVAIAVLAAVHAVHHALGPWWEPDTEQYHLSRDAAKNLVEMVLNEYHASHRR
jgi:hypothetical protein